MADIVDTAVNTGSFSILVTALKAADLVDTLKGKGPFTVFAPTDEAFEKWPNGTVNRLLKNIPKLKQILTYHVIAGKMMAADMTQLNSATTIEGSVVRFSTSKGFKVNNSTVTTPDVAADNGVIHSIDPVLTPRI
ncbi:MAG: fasciclin domain-containing protein [Leptolyngbyaceae cyanobacterium MO_188.B28]|nr:fasciclin domain-containing protein [Leptolyngbyaceae cyanobacterium MO_188.B28]